MAVYTHVNDAELAAFLADFDVGDLLSFKGIAEGVENTNFFVKTEKVELILTLFEKRVASEDLPFFIGLLGHLGDAGLPVAQPLANREGETIHKLTGKEAVLVRFLEGVSVHEPTRAQCGKIGSTLAKLHDAGLDYAQTRANALGPQGWQLLIERIGHDGESWQSGITDELKQEYAYLTKFWPQNLPKGVIHADVFPDNVLFVGDALRGVIDFYFACNDFLAYDLAVTLNAWCFEQDKGRLVYAKDKAQAMINAYEQVRALSKEEHQALPLLARGAAFRFFLTRLHDWIHHDPAAMVHPHDPRPFYERNCYFREAYCV